MDYRPGRRRGSNRSRRSGPSFSLKNIFVLNRLTKYLFFAIIAGFIAVPLLFLWYSRDIPTPGKLVESKYNDSTKIYDRNGVLLYSVYEDQNRTYVKLDEIPENLRNATIAIEDEDFYKNKGFSVAGYLRSVRNLLLSRKISGGGSTITQQLVKNVLLTNEQSLPRKIKELILAIQVDNRFSKDQVLEMYLNNIPYGGTAIGIEAASETYFGKKAKDLNLAESVFLAGLPQSPSLYSPFTGEKHYVGRSEAVLRQMVANNYIEEEEADKTLERIKKFRFSRRETSIKAPHFVMYVKRKLSEQFGERFVETGGLQVKTTLDYEVQKDAEKIVKEEIENLKNYKVSNGAALVTEAETGEILAMVGSKDYFDEENDGNFNAVFANRQPGSSLKPIVYAKAFEKGYTPATMLMDVKTEFPGGEGQEAYKPVNYSGKFIGPVQLRFALGNSLNIPAVKLLALVGLRDTMELAYRMGIANWDPTPEAMKNVGLSLILGGRETTLFDEVTAFGVFANKGVRHDLISILEVKDGNGKELFKAEKDKGDEVLSEEIAFLVSHILLDNNARTAEFGPNSWLRVPGRTVAVKTGTTDEKRDNWTIGYTPSYVVGVWVGNNDNTPMNKNIASGSTGASPIWAKIMQRVLKGKSNEEFEVPEGVVSMQVDSVGGGMPKDGQPTRSEYFVKGTEPKSVSPIYQREFLVFREDDPVSGDGKNRWQDGIQAWIEERHKDDPKYHPPGDILDVKKSDPTPTPEGYVAGDQATPTP
jgi:1A family penicillin-binding protein